MIEIPDVIQEIGAEDTDVLDRGIAEDLERETTIVIEEIGEIILLVDETLTGATDMEEIIIGTMTSATTDVQIILIPTRTTKLTLVMKKPGIRETTTYLIRVNRSLNVARDQVALAANTPKINPLHFFFPSFTIEHEKNYTIMLLIKSRMLLICELTL